MALLRMGVFGSMLVMLFSVVRAAPPEVNPSAQIDPTVRANGRGFVITDEFGDPVGDIKVFEGGESVTLLVSLTHPPIGEVEVFPTVSDYILPGTLDDLNCSHESFFRFVSALPERLVFTADNYAIPVPVTITNVDNFTPNSAYTCFLIFTTRALSDPDYNGVFQPSGSITRFDNEIGLFTYPTLTRTVREGGGLDLPMYLEFLSAPVEDVFVTVDPDEDCRINPGAPGQGEVLVFNQESTFFFMMGNYVAHDDSDIEGNHTCTLNFTTASANPAYNNLVIAPLIYNIIDNDAPGINMGLYMWWSLYEQSEDGDEKLYVGLSHPPVSDVTVTVTSNDQCILNNGAPFTLTFTAANAYQYVSIRGADDLLFDYDQICEITATATGDATYAGYVSPVLELSIDDNDINMLYNSDFEVNTDSQPSLPDRWEIRHAVGLFDDAKRVCDPSLARSFGCFFNFSSSARQEAQISQTVVMDDWFLAEYYPISVGNYVYGEAYCNAGKSERNCAINLLIKFEDGSTVRRAARMTEGGNGYQRVATTPFLLTRTDIESITITLKHPGNSGELLVDDLTIVLARGGASTNPDGLLGLPAQPAVLPPGFRH